MKKQFKEKKFGPQALEMIGRINGILTEYEKSGYDLSLRQLYYQLVSRNIVPNTEKSYKNVGGLVSDARLNGDIDWDMIKDRGREMTQNPHWETPKQFITQVAPLYGINLWDDQPERVEVMVEKQALEGVLEPVCRFWDVPFTANKGYSSSSAMYEAGRRLYEHLREEKPVKVIYLGDHDPSGIDMSRDVEDRLRQYAECTEGDTITIDVIRVALNIDQVRELNPPENPAKITDSRAKAYIQRFGRSSWELDAIEPKRLAKLVRDAIVDIIDMPKYEASKKRQEAGRNKMLNVAKQFKDV